MTFGSGSSTAKRIVVYTTHTHYAVLPLLTTAAEVMTDWTPWFRGRILRWSFITDVVSTGAGATRTVNLEIGTTDVTGTATAITLAGTATKGQVTVLGTPTAYNEFGPGDTVSIEVASGGTAFTAGAGQFVLTILQYGQAI